MCLLFDAWWAVCVDLCGLLVVCLFALVASWFGVGVC